MARTANFSNTRGVGANNQRDAEQIDLQALVLENLTSCIAEHKEIDRRNGGHGNLYRPEREAFSPANENDSHSYAVWFMSRMVEPEEHWSPAERYTRLSSSGGDGQGGAVYGYLSRVKMCLAAWLNMSKADKDFIHAGVTEEGVAWRGESPDRYALVLGESLKQREIGPQAYRDMAIKKLGSVVRRMST